MAICKLCGKEYKTTQGLRGHLTFTHGVTGTGTQPVTRLATEKQLNELNIQLEQTRKELNEVKNELNEANEKAYPFADNIATIFDTIVIPLAKKSVVDQTYLLKFAEALTKIDAGQLANSIRQETRKAYDVLRSTEEVREAAEELRLRITESQI